MFKVATLALSFVATVFLTGCISNSGASNRIELFSGNYLSGWRQPAAGKWMVAESVALRKDNPRLFAIEPGEGIFVNGAEEKAPNLLSVIEHGDCEAHIEFCISSNSNSGVYFQGRYEIQILDSWGVEHPKYGDCGGIYQRWKNDQGFEGHAPRVNASKRPGEWQTFDVVFRAPRFDANGKKTENARFIKVVHNGKLVHENVALTGPTRSSAFENESTKGPLMLQGDHGPVAYRNMWIRLLNQE